MENSKTPEDLEAAVEKLVNVLVAIPDQIRSSVESHRREQQKWRDELIERVIAR